MQAEERAVKCNNTSTKLCQSKKELLLRKTGVMGTRCSICLDVLYHLAVGTYFAQTFYDAAWEIVTKIQRVKD